MVQGTHLGWIGYDTEGQDRIDETVSRARTVDSEKSECLPPGERVVDSQGGQWLIYG